MVKILIITVSFIVFISNSVFACTTVIVGKNVSADGSAIYGRTDDGAGLKTTTITSVKASNEDGTYIYEDIHTNFKVELKKKHFQYILTPLLNSNLVGEWGEFGENEKGVSISATETLVANDTALKYDPYVKNGVAESNMMRLVLPYATSAREGVEILAGYVEKYGSAESNGIVFGDKNEIWYMEIYTGHQWAAVKCPDDKYAVIANDAMLGYINLDDKDNVMASESIYSMPKEKGFLKELNGKPHLALTYNKALRDYSQIRVWAGRKWFSSTEAEKYDRNKRYEIFDTPKKKISLKELFDFTRYRFEDTEYKDDVENYKVRPIGIERQANCHFIQIRKNKQDICWVCLANSEFSPYMPFYSNIENVPTEYKVDTVPYNSNSAFWKIKSVSTLVTKNRDKYGKKVKDEYNKLEDKWLEQINEMDMEYEENGKTSKIADKLFNEISTETFSVADKLLSYIITDMTAEIIADARKVGSDIE